MRVHTVQRARPSKHKRVCGHCQKNIEPGQSYRYAEPRYGPAKYRHSTCPAWRQSELTSGKTAQLLAIQEAAEDAVSAWGREDANELHDALTTAAEEARSLAEEYRESAENIESGFGHRVEKCDELESRADEIEAWADELESAADQLEEFDPEAAAEELREEFKVEGRTDTPEEFRARIEDGVEEKREEWADEQVTTAGDAINNMP